MSAPFYALHITAVGEYVKDYLKEQKLILFSAAAPEDIAAYCALHQAGKLTVSLSPGQLMKINQEIYNITAVGHIATANLKQLGHITLCFDGASVAELPGTVHLQGEPPQFISPGDSLTFYEAFN
ncbi:MAG: PTS glucitol/sorbitol transporter subunit IIA [Pantoea sp.]|nr:PTS glucitol/sorbitol transporter subunit IIA [Pantoea sp.]